MFYEQITFDTIFIPAEDDAYIDQILRYGSNTEDARMLIVAEFSKGKEDYTEFLKETYHGGYGIKTAGNTIATVEYEDDVVFRMGKSERRMKWSKIQERIDNLLTEGKFAFQSEIDGARDYEIRDIAESVSYIIWDTTADLWGEFEQRNGYPDLTNQVDKALRTKPKAIAEKLRQIIEMQKKGEEPLRFARCYHPGQLAERIDEIEIPRKEYKSILNEETVQMVITDYEIDKSLGAGSGVSGGKTRIKDYFAKESDASKRAEFLKNEYGIGGCSHAVSGASYSGRNHDAKGIELVKGDCRVTMNWKQVEKRIDRLIKDHKY